MKTFIITGMLAATLGSAEGAVTLGQVENFSGSHAWEVGAPSPLPPQVVADSGPLGTGDSALLLTANGSTGAGGRLIAFNETLWTGDYLSAGILSLAANLRNGGNSALAVRLALNGPGGWFVSGATDVPLFTGWVNGVFDLRPQALVSAGGSNAAATLAAVSELRILHSDLPDFRGARVTGSLLIDNLTAVPEPSSAVLGLCMAGIGCFFRKR